MAKLTLNRINSFVSGMLSILNVNWGRIEQALENTLSRDGSTPNAMNSVIDMNNHRIINVAEPSSDNDAVRKIDLEQAVASFSGELGGNVLFDSDIAVSFENNPDKVASASSVFELDGRIDSITTGNGVPTIQNNLTTTSPGSTLDAVQGKVLKDYIDKATTFDTRTLAVGVDVGSSNYVLCRACTSNGPKIPMVFEVSTGTTGGANDAADLLAGKIQFANNKYGTLVPLGNAYWAEWFGARPNDSTFDSTAAIQAAVAIASKSTYGLPDGVLNERHDNGGVDRSRYGVLLGPGLYYTSGTISLEVNAGFRGSWLRGSGVETTVIVFSPATIGTPCIQARGGSGNSTNKAVSDLTIRRNSTTTPSTWGIGLLVNHQNLLLVDRLLIVDLAVGVELLNSVVGGFTEFNKFNDVRIVNCTWGVAIHRVGGGYDSFHGNEFHNVIINVPVGGHGLRLGGARIDGTASSGRPYLYNMRMYFHIFGASTTLANATAIYHDNINMEMCKGDIQCENRLKLESANTGDGFALDGMISFLHAPDFGTNGSWNMFRFSRMTQGKNQSLSNVGGNFTNANISNFYPVPGQNILTPVDRVNTIGGTMMTMWGANRASMMAVCLQNAGFSYENGFYWGETTTNLDPKSVTPRAYLRADGQMLGTFQPTFVIREMGGSGSDQQLFVNNGRFGGRMGRLPPVTSVASNVSPQTISLWINNNEARSSEFYLRIISTTPGSYNRYIRGFFVRGPASAAGDVVIIREHSFIDTTAGAVTTPTFAVTSSGQLTMTLTTDRALTISGWEFSGGEIQTT